MIYPGQVLPQCVLCIFIRLKALRKTYHLNDQMLLDLSLFFFYTQKTISKGQNFLIWNKLLFFSGTSFMSLSKTKEESLAEGHGSLWCLQCTWHPWICLLLGHRAVWRAGCFQSHTCFVCSINPMSLLHSFHNIWHVSLSPTLG